MNLRASVPRCVVGVCIVAMWLAGASPVEAQTGFGIRGFADVGSTSFTAAESFEAVLGSERGVVFGGGVEAILPWRLFVNLRASRFRQTGERLFVFNGEQFDLGIPTTITVTPVELTGGVRVGRLWRVVPYGGLGVGWHRYKETSRFAEPSENVEDQHTGFQVVGGGEVGFTRWLAAAAEIQWATVPDAFGDDPNGVAAEFDENNLGGVTFRAKIVVGN